MPVDPLSNQPFSYRRSDSDAFLLTPDLAKALAGAETSFVKVGDSKAHQISYQISVRK